MAYQEVKTLSCLGFGVVEEQFKKQLKSVLDNIQNKSTEPKASRGINISITFKPTEDRESSEIIVKAVSRLAPVREDKLSVRFDLNKEGEMVLTQKEPENQLELFENKERRMAK